MGKIHSATVGKTEDESLLVLSHEEQNHKADFIVDCLNPRFLAFHTLSNAKVTDRFIISRLTQYDSEFDLFWFPVSLLEATERREHVTGFEVQFDPLLDGSIAEGIHNSDHWDISKLTEDGKITASHRFPHKPKLAMKIERPEAMQTYKDLKDRVPDLLPDIPLNGVIAERTNEELFTFARAHIRSYGKITGRGPDFYSYIQIVDGTLDSYSDVVHGLEEKYWIKFEPRKSKTSSGFTVTGEPFMIEFSREVNLESLIELLFDCKWPFRLMGSPDQIQEDYFSVKAIDLHVNQRISFDIAPDFIRVYLHEGTCGNTIVRLIRSLQHHVDSTLKHPPLFE